MNPVNPDSTLNPQKNEETAGNPQLSKVTKNQGRVAAGKRLAEWNKQKQMNKEAKEKLINKSEDLKGLDTSHSNSVSSVNYVSSVMDYKTLAIVIIGGGLVVLYNKYKVNKSQKPKSKSEELSANNKSSAEEQLPPKSVQDPFYME